MELLTGLFSGGNVVKSIAEGLDNLFTSDEERLKARSVIEAEMHKFQLSLESELTARHAADMASDSKLPKLIRPMTLIYLLAIKTGIMVMDYLGYELDEDLIALEKALLLAAFGFYFGSRGLEKIAAAWKK